VFIVSMSTADVTSTSTAFEREQLNVQKELLHYKRRKLEILEARQPKEKVMRMVSTTKVTSSGPNDEFLTFCDWKGEVVITVKKSEISLIHEPISVGGGSPTYPIDVTLKDGRVFKVGWEPMKKPSEILAEIFTEFDKK